MPTILDNISARLNPEKLSFSEATAAAEIIDNLLCDVCCCTIQKKGEGKPLPYENELLESLLIEWARAEKISLQEAMALIKRLREPIKIDDVNTVLELLNAGIDDYFPEAVKASVASTLYDSYRKAKKSIFKKFKFKMEWSLIDDNAVTWLRDHHMYWIDNYYSKQLSSKIAEHVMAGISEGLGRKDIGDRLKEFFTDYPGISAKPDSYWRGLAANAMNRSRIFGSIAGYDDLGIKYLQVIAVMDERTSAICFPKGTIISTAIGYKNIEHIKPGESVLTGSGKYCRVNAVSQRESKKWILIKLLSGNLLITTFNHPILTSNGWKKAIELNIGDKIAEKNRPRIEMPKLRQNIQRRKTESSQILFRRMLSASENQECLGYTNMCILQKEIQGANYLCREKRSPALQSSLSKYVSSQGSESEFINSEMQGLWKKISDKTNRIFIGKNKKTLFSGLSEAPRFYDLSDMWERIRIQIGGEKTSEILLGRMLSKSPLGLISRIARSGNIKRVWNKTRNRKEVGKLFYRFFPAEIQYSNRSGRSLYAYARKENKFKNKQRNYDFKCGFPVDTINGRRFEARTGEKSPSEYLNTASGLDTIIDIQFISLDDSIPAYNLQVNDDPTYIANGLIVHNCQLMNGQVIPVSAAVRQRDAMMSAKSPEDVKNISPWVPAKELNGLNINQIMARGVVLPPYHFHCRTDVVEVSGQQPST